MNDAKCHQILCVTASLFLSKRLLFQCSFSQHFTYRQTNDYICQYVENMMKIRVLSIINSASGNISND